MNQGEISGKNIKSNCGFPLRDDESLVEATAALMLVYYRQLDTANEKKLSGCWNLDLDWLLRSMPICSHGPLNQSSIDSHVPLNWSGQVFLCLFHIIISSVGRII